MKEHHLLTRNRPVAITNSNALRQIYVLCQTLFATRPLVFNSVVGNLSLERLRIVEAGGLTSVPDFRPTLPFPSDNEFLSDTKEIK